MKRILTVCLLLAAALQLSAKEYGLVSPDGSLSVRIDVADKVTWSLSAGAVALLEPSEIALSLSDGRQLGIGNKVKKVTKSSCNESVPALYFKRSVVRDNYNQLKLDFKEGFSLVFRLYDDGAAYRFVYAGKACEVAGETAAFRFAGDWNLYVPYVCQHTQTLESQFYNSFENTYAHHPLSGWRKDRLAFLPLTVEAADGIKLCLTESDLRDYPGMYLYNGDGDAALEARFAPYPKEIRQGGHNMLQGEVQTREEYIARVEGPRSFPWRVVMVAREDKQLTDNDMVFRLAAPAAEGDWSWVKPGKVAWDWWNAWNLYDVDFRAGINNDTYRHYIDFASEHGIEYVILDEGWAVNKQADLMQVIPEIDLPMLTKYAAERGVGLILWAGYWAFNRDMEGICRHYAAMGIKGWKIDFMDRDDQPMVKFYEDAAATAARYRMVVDFHGAFKPAGLQRTYPNVLNFEGVHGLEQMKWSGPEVDQVTYDVTIPFVRLAAGSADYTQGAMRNATKRNYRPVNSEPMSQGTRCRQLAEYVLFDAPLMMLCDSPSNYRKEPECTAFIAAIPTVWDETLALDGRIAEYAVLARRNGSTWYIGAMTDWKARDMEIPLDFLPEGSYTVTVYRDGPNADRAARDFRMETTEATAATTLRAHLAPGGGWAARLEPVR